MAILIAYSRNATTSDSEMGGAGLSDKKITGVLNVQSLFNFFPEPLRMALGICYSDPYLEPFALKGLQRKPNARRKSGGG